MEAALSSLLLSPIASLSEHLHSYKPWITLIAIVLMIICMALQLYPSSVLVLTTLAFLWACGVISEKDALRGFSSSGLTTVMALFAVMNVAMRGQILRKLIMKCFGNGKSPKKDLIRQMIMCALVSGLMNNSPLVAAMVPLSKDWTRKFGFAPSKYLMPLEFCISAGGLLTMVGTSTTLVIRGLLQGDANTLPEGSEMTFFDIGKIGLPCVAIVILFLATIGYRILPSHAGGLFRVARQQGMEFMTQLRIPDNHEWIDKPVISTILSSFPTDEVKVLELLRPISTSVYSQPTPIVTKKNDSSKFSFRSADYSQELSGSFSSLPLLLDDSGGMNINGQYFPPVPKKHPKKKERKIQNIPTIPTDNAGMSASLLPMEQKEEEAEEEADAASSRLPSIPNKEQDNATNFYRRIFPVSFEDTFQAEDVVIILVDSASLVATHRNSVSSPHAKSASTKLQGIPLCPVSNESLQNLLPEMVEAVLSDTNPFLGSTASDPRFAEHYDCAVLAARHRGITETNDLRSWNLNVGDTLLLISTNAFMEKWGNSSDFYVTSQLVSKSATISFWKDVAGIVILLGVFAAFASQIVPPSLAAITGVCIAVLLRLIPMSECIASGDGGLFILVGGSIGLGQCLDASGLAEMVGQAITEYAHLSGRVLLMLVYLITLGITEIVTNNAAATLAYPIAKAVALNAGLAFKPFVLCVCIAASSGYILPIGYQCHMMIVGPGGYSMLDFLKVGVCMDLIFFAVSMLLIPYLWPLGD